MAAKVFEKNSCISFNVLASLDAITARTCFLKADSLNRVEFIGSGNPRI